MVNEPIHPTLDAILGASRHFEGTRLQGGGPAGKLRDGDVIEIVINRQNLTGSINFVGMAGEALSSAEADASLVARPSHPHLQPHPDLPDDTRLWAAL